MTGDIVSGGEIGRHDGNVYPLNLVEPRFVQVRVLVRQQKINQFVKWLSFDSWSTHVLSPGGLYLYDMTEKNRQHMTKNTHMIDLHEFELIVINTSGGKDSLASIIEVLRIADLQGYPKDRIKLSHQDLGKSEWKGTTDLVKRQAEHFGLDLEIECRMLDGRVDTIQDYAERRGAFPSSKARFCTSEFKRSPGAMVLRRLAKGIEGNVLYVFGFRADESSARAKRPTFIINKRLTTKKRIVMDWLPIHSWSSRQVWDAIEADGVESHEAYSLGMPRLSCVFCIMASKDALVIAGKHNPELLDSYIETEKKINHSFQEKLSLQDVKDLIASGYEPKEVRDWTM